MFEEKREKMHKDKTTETPFSWLADVCSLYIGPFAYDCRKRPAQGDGAAERTTHQIVRGFFGKIDKRLGMKYVLDTIRDPALDQK
jgi:hypothetical protein